MILSLPALEAARAEYTEVWAPRPVLPLIRFADRTRAIADTGLELVGVVEGARVPALEAFDSIYSWYGANRPEFREGGGAICRSRFSRRCRRRAEGIPRIETPQRPIEEFIGRFIPSRARLSKRWPMERFRAVAPGFGRPGEVDRGSGGAARRTPCALTIYMSSPAGWLRREPTSATIPASLILAAAVGTPVVAIFLTHGSAHLGAARQPCDRAGESCDRGSHRSGSQNHALSHLAGCYKKWQTKCKFTGEVKLCAH